MVPRRSTIILSFGQEWWKVLMYLMTDRPVSDKPWTTGQLWMMTLTEADELLTDTFNLSGRK
jgi:hypothetical protein